MNDQFIQLYNYLKSNGMTDLDAQSFYNEYRNDDSNFNELYGYLKSNGMTDLDANSFKNSYFNTPSEPKEQKWRSVTKGENAGRLDYRKGDFRTWDIVEETQKGMTKQERKQTGFDYTPEEISAGKEAVADLEAPTIEYSDLKIRRGKDNKFYKIDRGQWYEVDTYGLEESRNTRNGSIISLEGADLKKLSDNKKIQELNKEFGESAIEESAIEEPKNILESGIDFLINIPSVIITGGIKESDDFFGGWDEKTESTIFRKNDRENIWEQHKMGVDSEFMKVTEAMAKELNKRYGGSYGHIPTEEPKSNYDDYGRRVSKSTAVSGVLKQESELLKGLPPLLRSIAEPMFYLPSKIEQRNRGFKDFEQLVESFITNTNIAKMDETDAVPLLTEEFGRFGFEFIEGLGDQMIVRTKDGLKEIAIDLDNLLDENNISSNLALRDFLITNQDPSSYEGGNQRFAELINIDRKLIYSNNGGDNPTLYKDLQMLFNDEDYKIRLENLPYAELVQEIQFRNNEYKRFLGGKNSEQVFKDMKTFQQSPIYKKYEEKIKESIEFDRQKIQSLYDDVKLDPGSNSRARQKSRMFFSEKYLDKVRTEYNARFKDINLESKLLYDDYQEYNDKVKELSNLKLSPDQKRTKQQELDKIKLNLDIDRSNLIRRKKAVANDVKNIEYLSGKYFVDVAKEGGFIGAVMNSFSSGISKVINAADIVGRNEAETKGSQTADYMTTEEKRYYNTKGYSVDEIKIAATNKAYKESKELLTSKIKSTIGDMATTKEYQQSEDRGIVSKALFGLAESLPAMATAAIPYIGGAVSFTALSAQAYSSLEDEMLNDPDFETTSLTDMNLIAVPYAIGMGALEKIGLSAAMSKSPLAKSLIMKTIQGTILKTAGKGSAELFQNVMNKEIKSNMAKFGLRIVGGALTEAETGATQSLVLDIGYKKLINEIKKDDILSTKFLTGGEFFNTPDTFMDGLAMVIEDGIAEGIGGMIMSGAGAAFQKVINGNISLYDNEDVDFLKTVSTDNNLRKMIVIDLKAKMLSGKITKSEAQSQLESLDKVSAIFNSMPDNLSVEDQVKSVNLMSEKQRLEKEIDGKDQSLVAAQKERITEIDNELQNISKDAFQKQTTGEATVGEEGEPTDTKAETNVIQVQKPRKKGYQNSIVKKEESITKSGDKVTKYTAYAVDENGNEKKMTGNGILTTIGELAPLVKPEEGDANIFYDEDGNLKHDPDAEITITKTIEGKQNDGSYQQRITVIGRGDVFFEAEVEADFISNKNIVVGETSYKSNLTTTDTKAENKTEEGQEITIDKPIITTNTTSEVDRVKSVDIEAEDGATFNIDGTKYEGGGLVVPIVSENTTVEEITPEMISDFVEKHSSKIGDQNTVKVGIYKFPNSNKVSIDLNIVAPESSRQQAIEFAKSADQESLFDLSTLENVKTGGTGANPTQFTDEQFKEIARSLNEGRAPSFAVLTETAPVVKQDITQNQVTLDNVDEVSNKQMATATKLVLNALPGVKIYIHKTNEEYSAAIGAEAEAGDRGAYDTEEGAIHINLSAGGNAQTVFHEAIHHALLKKGMDSGAILDLANGLNRIITDKKLKKRLSDFVSQYETSDQSEEYVSELGAIMAESEIELTTTKFNQFKALIAKIFQKLGLPKSMIPFLNAMNSENAVEFINGLTRSLRTGEEITDISNTQEIKNPIEKIKKSKKIGSSKTKIEIVYVEQDRMQELIDKGLLEQVKDISIFNEKYVATTSPDDMLVGNIFINGDLKAEGNGGVFFVTKFGDVWASSNKIVADQIAKRINKSLEINGGKGYLVLVKGTDAKLISSPQGASSSLKIVEALASDGLISASDFRKSIISALQNNKDTKAKINFSGKSSSADMISAVDSLFDDVSKSSFDNRGTLLKSIVFELGKTESIKNNNKKIIEFLGGDTSKNIGWSETSKNTNTSQSAIDLIAGVSREELTKGLNGGDIYAIIEVNDEVIVSKDSHQSYPFHIKQKNGKAPKLILLENRQNGRDVMVSSSNKSIDELGKSFDGKVLGRASNGYGDGYINTEKSSKGKQFKKQKTDKLTEPVAGNKLFNEPLKDAEKIAQSYMQSIGMEYVPVEKITKLDEDLSKRISDAYDQMENNPNDPEVKAAYEAMAKETLDQYDAILKEGYNVEINNNEPYSNSEAMIKDLKDNKRMNIFSTESGFGDEPITDEQRSENLLLKDSGRKDVNGETLLINDVFRFVHDFFGHAKLGNSFGPIGEENAWRVHSEMYSPEAKKAMTSETRGQNSFVNFSGVNDAVFKKRDKARELRKEGKIEEADRLVGEVYEEMSFADQKVGLLPSFAVEEGAPSKIKKQKTTTKTEAIQNAKDEQEVNAAIDNLQKSDWYENADDTAREDAVREIKAFFGEKIKKAPSVAKILGKPKPETQTKIVDALRKEFFTAWNKASRKAKADLNSKRKAIGTIIKSMVRSGKITIKQAASITDRASSINLDNPVIVQRFLDYVAKVFADANYQEKLSNAFTTRKAIRRLTKSNNQAEVIGMAKMFLNIDPSMVEDIDTYNEIADSIKNAMAPSVVRGEQVKFKQPANIADVNEYTMDELSRQEEIRKDQLLAEYDYLKEAGLISKDMTLNEIKSIIEEMKSPEAETENNKVNEFVTRRLDMMLGVVESIIRTGVNPITGEAMEISDKNKDILKAIMKMDLKELDTRSLIYLSESVDNFLNNGITSGLEANVQSYIGAMNVKALVNAGVKSVSIRTVISRSASKEILSIPLFFEKIFRGTIMGNKVMKEMGFLDLVRGKNTAEMIYNMIMEEYTKQDFYGKDFMTHQNIIERGMLGYLMRNVNGDPLQVKSELNRRIESISQSIDRLKEGNKDEQKLAEMYEIAYSKLNLKSKDIDLIRANSSKQNRQAVDWWIDQWKQHYTDLYDVSLSVYNTMLSSDTNYTPDKQKLISSRQTADQDISKTDSSFGSNLQYTDTKKSGVLMENSRSLGKNRYIDLNFDSNNANSLRNALVDIKTAGTIRQLKGFIDSENFYKLAGDQAAVIKDRVNTYVKRMKGKGVMSKDNYQEVMKYFNALSKAGTIRALGGIGSAIKQFSPIINTLINSGRFTSLTPSSSAWIDRLGMPISNRGIQAEANIDSINKKTNALSESPLGKVYDGVSQVGDMWLKALIQYPDVYVARSSFITYYLKSLRDQGLSEKIDWDNHVENKKASEYAQIMLDRQQNISDPLLAGDLFMSENNVKTMVTKVIMPFTSFVWNQRARMINDIQISFSKHASNEDKKIARLSLIALPAEIIVFNVLGAAIRKTIDAITNYLYGEDDDEEEVLFYVFGMKITEDDIKEVKTPIRNMLVDLFSPLPGMTDEPLVSGLNKLFEQFPLIGDDEISELVKVENDIRIANGEKPMDDKQKEKFIEQEKEKRKFQLYENMEPTGLERYIPGAPGVALKTYTELYDAMSLALTGKYETENEFGKKTIKYISDEDRKKIGYGLYFQIAQVLNLLPREAGTITSKGIRNIKRRASTENKKTKTEELEKMINRPVGKIEKVLIDKNVSSKNIFIEMKYIDKAGGFTESQQNEYAKLRKIISKTNYYYIKSIQSGMTSEDIIKRIVEARKK